MVEHLESKAGVATGALGASVQLRKHCSYGAVPKPTNKIDMLRIAFRRHMAAMSPVSINLSWNRVFSNVPLPKDDSREIASHYDPVAVEKGWYSWWENSGFFEPEPVSESSSADRSKPSFSMVIPPPNVTGSLHIGHALTNTLQDALVRWRRMQGFRVQWIPGLDHAGIATQSIVEKHIQKTLQCLQKSRHDLGREEFIKNVWLWKEQYGGRINSQLRQLGLSLAWRQEAFTLDRPRSEAVTQAFIRLHQQGFIYRGQRMIHWCTHLRTAISDIEVEYVEVTARAKHKLPNGRNVDVGLIHRLFYDIVDASNPSIVAGRLPVDTTRPETILGDQAVAVHPEDERYQLYHGKHVLHPITRALLPIVLDSVLVDRELGTGVVKVTPGHDMSDWECGQRHKLAVVNILNDDGTMNSNVPQPYQGMHRFQCREAIIQALTASGHYQGSRDHAMRISICSRSGDILEPMLKPQWFVRCNEMYSQAIDAVRNGDLKLFPASQQSEWERWLGNSNQSWCISRQLWWGHRIPAYRVTIKPSEHAPHSMSHTADSDAEVWEVADSKDAARRQAARRLNVPAEHLTLEQDEDVLDTWFSSALFPMSVFNWPQQSTNFDASYPLQVMVTGRDIMFFWVARMVIMCSQLSPKQQLPFSQVVLHPLIQGSDGRKMSKSLGNVIDPCDLMEGKTLKELLDRLKASNLDPKQLNIAEALTKKDYPNGMQACGADALRMALLMRVNLDNYISLDYKKVLSCRQFANKIWQASRFVFPYIDIDSLKSLSSHRDADFSSPSSIWKQSLQPAELIKLYPEMTLPQKWILHHLSSVIIFIDQQMEQFAWRPCADEMSSFFYTRFCDVFLEFSKTGLAPDATTTPRQQAISRAVLTVCLETFLRLLHPMMPFLSEELWQRLPPSVRSMSSATLAATSSASETIMKAPYPKPSDWAQFCQSDVAKHSSLQFEEVLSVLSAMRKLFDARKSALNLTPQMRQHPTELVDEILIFSESETLASDLRAHIADLALLMRVKPSTIRLIASLSDISTDFSTSPVSLTSNSLTSNDNIASSDSILSSSTISSSKLPIAFVAMKMKTPVEPRNVKL